MANLSELRIIYMGTPEFAVEPLRAMLKVGLNVVAVITAPDKPAGRGKKISQSAVKQFATSKGLNVVQPNILKSSDFIELLKNLKPHIIVVVAFRMLPKMVWSIPSLGTFNLHASLLPQYRGAAPINWAVINGEQKTGLTTFLIDDKIDTGKILLRREVSILPDETAGELHDRLMPLGGQLVVETIEMIASGKVKPIPQHLLVDSDTVLKQAPKLYRETTCVSWDKPAMQVNNFIRGLSPYPAAWSEITQPNGKKFLVKILRSSLVDNQKHSKGVGLIETDGKTYIHVYCGIGVVSITQIQLAGKRPLAIKDFLAGFKDIETYFFF